MSEPIVSIIIPTHERAKYAVPTIRSILSLSAELEVVVSDSSAEDLISEEFDCNPNLSKLKLVRTNKALNVVNNFNEALTTATGKYLTFIGDDDFVSEEITTVAKWAERHQIDAIKFSFPILYFWPDFHHKTQQKAISGTLRINKFNGKVIPHDAKTAAIQALENFGGGVLEMPRAYAGLVSMELVKRIQMKNGPLFGGVSPDIYSAFLISQEAKKCVYLDYPVIIPGASAVSTAGKSANGKHVGVLRENSHIKPFRDLVWDKLIPEFYSVPTVWSYSLLKAVEEHGGGHLAHINFARLYVKCLIFHKKFLKDTLVAITNYRHGIPLKNFIWSGIKAILSEASWIAKKIIFLLIRKFTKFDKEYELTDITDTVAASKALQVFLKQNGARLELP